MGLRMIGSPKMGRASGRIGPSRMDQQTNGQLTMSVADDDVADNMTADARRRL